MVADAAFPTLSAPAWPGKLTRFGTRAIAVGALLVAISGPLNRFTPIGFQAALLLLVAGVVALLVGALLAIVGFLVALSKGSPVSKGSVALAIVVALGLLGYLLSWLRAGMGVPPIHEISTDLASPPPFVAVLPLRAQGGAVNPPEYVAEIGGRNGKTNVPEAQRKAFPDIQPVILEGVAPAAAFVRAEAAARQLGWKVVAAVPDEGRIEATDTTAFFAFKDDVVIRLRAEGGGTRIDVRSKSRVGVGDVGANAARVRKFLALVKAGA
ncbi:MAG: DUF1499 domain-containing protein [Steroidobacteraceae bacterium]|jgi:hypothetical protein|nr:DUF1499 domain-containing protein [Steroidobacteraceae bacterium]